MKSTFQTAIMSITGTAAAIAIGFFSAQYFGSKPGIILGGGMFGTGAAMSIRHAFENRRKITE